MDRRAAKEKLHIRDWLRRADGIIERGKDRYLADELLQEAGDSLMMKLGEAAIIHQYDAIDREQTWLTLSVDLPGWHASLQPKIEQAEAELEA